MFLIYESNTDFVANENPLKGGSHKQQILIFGAYITPN